jgi:hypothetical protein
MLIDKGYEKDDIVSFKIVNGDEIVAKLVEEGDDHYVINKPTTVIPSQQGLGLVQSLFTGDLEKNVRLEKKHVMLHSTTIKDVVNHYIKTTTGIETAPAGGIVS